MWSHGSPRPLPQTPAGRGVVSSGCRRATSQPLTWSMSWNTWEACFMSRSPKGHMRVTLLHKGIPLLTFFVGGLPKVLEEDKHERVQLVRSLIGHRWTASILHLQHRTTLRCSEGGPVISTRGWDNALGEVGCCKSRLARLHSAESTLPCPHQTAVPLPPVQHPHGRQWETPG